MNHKLIYCPENIIRDYPHIKIKKGELIVCAGNMPDYVYIVLYGIANISYLTSKGKSVVTSQFIKGDYIGEINAICNQLYTFDCIAQTDMELVKIPSGDFVEKMKTDFKMVQSMVQSQYNRINYVEAFSVINTTFSLYERVLLFLCCLMSIDELKNTFTKEFLVSCTGSDLRCVNRILKKMREKQLIEVKRGKITVIDYDKLKKEAVNLDVDYQIEFFFNCILDGIS